MRKVARSPGMGRVAARLSAVAMIWTFTALAPAQDVGILGAYQGKYKDDARLAKQAGNLEALRAAALTCVAEKMGLTPADPQRIRIELRDALSSDPEKLAPFTGPPFQTRWADAGQVQIVLHTEFLVNGRFDVDTELRHEMVHAVMRTAVTPEAYGTVPVWVREGLAVWTAGQTEDKARWVLRQEEFLTQPDRAVQGLPPFVSPAGKAKPPAGAAGGAGPVVDEPGGPAALRRYAEYALAIEYLAERCGAEAVQKLARALAHGTPAQTAVAEASGQDWEAFAAAARQHAVARLAKLRPPETDAYAAIVKADDGRQYAEVEKLCAAFLKANPKSTLRGNVLYLRGKANRLQKKAGAAESALKELLDHPEQSDFVEKALYQLASTRAEAGRHSDAVDPCRRLLRDHPDSDVLDRGLYTLALCRSKAGNRREALRLLDVFDRSFAKSEVASKARELRQTLEKTNR